MTTFLQCFIPCMYVLIMTVAARTFFRRMKWRVTTNIEERLLLSIGIGLLWPITLIGVGVVLVIRAPSHKELRTRQAEEREKEKVKATPTVSSGSYYWDEQGTYHDGRVVRLCPCSSSYSCLH